MIRPIKTEPVVVWVDVDGMQVPVELPLGMDEYDLYIFPEIRKQICEQARKDAESMREGLAQVFSQSFHHEGASCHGCEYCEAREEAGNV